MLSGSAEALGRARVVPRRFFDFTSPSLSSNQSEALLASFEATGRAAFGEAGSSGFECVSVVEDLAVTPPFFLRRLICRPSSSLEVVKSESDFTVGGGGAFRIVDFDLFALFLNVARR
jgi:hypothetical protein